VVIVYFSKLSGIAMAGYRTRQADTEVDFCMLPKITTNVQ
jgi:hypothetical protein